MGSRKNLREELSKLAPRLSSLEPKNTFKLPVDYFASFPGKLRERGLVVTPPKGWPAFGWENAPVYWRRKWQIASMAAVALLLVLAGIYLLDFSAPQSDATFNISDLTVEEVDLYLVQNVDEIEEALLLEYFGEPELDFVLDLKYEIEDEEVRDYILDDFSDLRLQEELL